MSIVEEIKEHIVRASESLDEAKSALIAGQTAHEKATQGVSGAAGDSGHEKIVEAMGAFKKSGEKLEEIVVLIAKGQKAANEYAESLG